MIAILINILLVIVTFALLFDVVDILEKTAPEYYAKIKEILNNIVKGKKKK